MGLYLYKSGTVKTVPYNKNGRIISVPTFLFAAFCVKNRMFEKTADKKTATLPCEMLLFGRLVFYQSLMFLNLFITSPETIPITTPVAVPVMMSTGR